MLPNQYPQNSHQTLQLQTVDGGKICGSLKVNYFIWVFIPTLFCTPLYTYHMAVKNKQQPPFPHATITNTACHYPQDTVFRFAMLLAVSFLSLLYFVIFRWTQYEKKRTQFPLNYHPSWLFAGSELSIFGYMAAIGTIDSQGYSNVHTVGAVIFFLVLFAVTLNLTLYLSKMHNWDPSVLSCSSYYIKRILCYYLTGLVFYCLIGEILQVLEGSNDDDKYIVIIEWNLVLFCLIWIFSFKGDWKDIYICLKEVDQQNQELQQLE